MLKVEEATPDPIRIESTSSIATRWDGRASVWMGSDIPRRPHRRPTLKDGIRFRPPPWLEASPFADDVRRSHPLIFLHVEEAACRSCMRVCETITLFLRMRPLRLP